MQVAGGPGRADPLVSVALRSDASVGDVTIVRLSGSAGLDEAVRRIVRLNARYAAFPPIVAARFDVIEIRRIWLFAGNLKTDRGNALAHANFSGSKNARAMQSSTVRTRLV